MTHDSRVAITVSLSAIGCLAAFGLLLGLLAVALVIRSTAATRRNNNHNNATPGGKRHV